MLQKSAELGCMASGAYADLIVVNDDSLKYLAIFRDAKKNIPILM